MASSDGKKAVKGEMKGKAFAKINLALNIKGRREDGYHEMDMLMAKVSLFDEIEVRRLFDTDESVLVVRSGAEDGNELANNDNLILKAHREVEKAAGRRLPCEYILNKKIPVAAGLGGGSSDAAFTVSAINELYGLGFSREKLREIAARVGSDMPFFLFCGHGNVARATGRGTELADAGVKICSHAIIIKACPGLSTAEVFSLFKNHGGISPDIDGVLDGLKRRDFKALEKHGGNALFPAALSLRPEIAEAIDALYKSGALYAAMSGSGPSVFGLFQDESDREGAFNDLKERYGEVFACEII
ncbi:MAG: 4-(cytidine 5'-diphospho)-2-C-methyl-D-erythritol kinase [Christensenellales bacterium]|jgi:4-diphosphocytidyl-2-C-methyl-D-erythritol kinase